MRVFVACSSSDSVNMEYRNIATEVCTMLAKNGHKLVYSGADTGMMGKCYMTYKYEGGKVKAIVELHDKQTLENLEVDAYEVTTSTFDRTKLLFESSEVVLILPGGLETFAELFSIMEEVRTKNSDTKVILFNFNNYFTPLLKYLTNCHEEGFISGKELKCFNIVTDVKSLEIYIRSLEKKER